MTASPPIDPLATALPRGGQDIRIRRVPDFGQAEFLTGRYRDVSFARHSHERAALCVITRGVLNVAKPGGTEAAGAGQMILMNADCVHWGDQGADQGWDIRKLYLDPAILDGLARELWPRLRGTTQFRLNVVDDPRLRTWFLHLHRVYGDGEAGGPEALAKQTGLLALLTQALRRHGDVGRAPDALVPAPRAVGQARTFIQDHAAEPISLEHLAATVGLSPYHLARAFTAAVGMPPHAYQVQRRVSRACGMLRAQMPVAEVAAACGFADQSHLTRCFKRLTGLTPARFRAA